MQPKGWNGRNITLVGLATQEDSRFPNTAEKSPPDLGIQAILSDLLRYSFCLPRSRNPRLNPLWNNPYWIICQV